jgi:hypothetical protein
MVLSSHTIVSAHELIDDRADGVVGAALWGIDSGTIPVIVELPSALSKGNTKPTCRWLNRCHVKEIYNMKVNGKLLHDP